MIYAFSGDDIQRISDSILNIKKKFPESEIIEISSASKMKDKLINLSSSLSLLGSKNIVIVEVLSKDSDFICSTDFLNLIESYKNNEDIIIFNFGDHIAKNTKIYKKIFEYCKIQELSIKPDFWNFNLCDELIINKNKKKALEIVMNRNEKDLKESFYPLISLMQTYARMIVSQKFDNKFWKIQKPFFRSKFENKNIRIEEAIDLYKKLLDIEVASKSSSTNLKSLLLDFIIYTEYH